MPQAKRREKEKVYSLWTAPQSAWVLFLDKVDVARRRKNVRGGTKARPPPVDRDLQERRKAFETQVDQESLIRYVY